MKGYKLTNTDGTVFAYFNDKDLANTSAGQHFALRGTMLKMEEVELPAFKVEYYDLIARGEEIGFEADSIEQLKIDAMDYAEHNNIDLNDEDAQSVAFGYDEHDNEVFVLEAL